MASRERPNLAPIVRKESYQSFKDSTAIDEAIAEPGAINIDVTGAFITHESLHLDGDYGSSHHSEDIRLPHHTSVVSHVAVDVGILTTVRC